MQEQNGRTLKAAGAASVGATYSVPRNSARCCYRVPSSHRPSDRGRDLSRVPSVRPQALHRGPRPHPLKAQRALRARGPQRAPAPVTPPSARLSNRHLPSSPRIRTCNPFGQWRPEKKPLIVTVSTSVSHSHHLPPKRSNSPPRAPREARQRGLFGDPLLPPWPKLQPLLRLFGNRPTRATEFAQRQKHIELSRQHKALSCLVTLRGESRRLGYYTHPSASALLSPPTYPTSSRQVLALSRWTSMS